MIPALAVPCPTRSSGGAGTMRQPSPSRSAATLSTRRPPTAGCEPSTPESTIATRSPPAGPVAEGPRPVRAAPRTVAPDGLPAAGRERPRSRRGAPRSSPEPGRRPRGAAGERVEDLDDQGDLARRGGPSARDGVGEGPQRAVAVVEPGHGGRHGRVDRLVGPVAASRRPRAAPASPAAARRPRARPGSPGSRPRPGARRPRRARCRAARTPRRRAGRAPPARRSCRRRPRAARRGSSAARTRSPAAAERSNRGSAATSLTASGWPVVNTYPTMPSLGPIDRPTAPSPAVPAATRMTSRSVAASWSAIDAASASNSVTVASATDRSTASPPGGSRRSATAARAATASSASSRRSSRGSLMDMNASDPWPYTSLGPRVVRRTVAAIARLAAPQAPQPPTRHRRTPATHEGDRLTAAAQPAVKISPTAVFKKRDFVLMWVAQLVSTAGSSLTDLAAGIYVYSVTGSAFLVGVTLMATAVPSLVVGLHRGRVRRPVRPALGDDLDLPRPGRRRRADPVPARRSTRTCCSSRSS